MFQIFAQLIEVRGPGDKLPDTYLLIFPPLLTPVFWERSGNIPALVRLLQVGAGACWMQECDVSCQLQGQAEHWALEALASLRQGGVACSTATLPSAPQQHGVFFPAAAHTCIKD